MTEPDKKPAAASNPFLLLGNTAGSNLPDGDAASSESMPDFGGLAEHESSRDLLATMDTDHIRAMRDRADALVAKSEKYILPEAADVRALADSLDASIAADADIPIGTLHQIRDHVRTIMTTLRAHPEFSTILLDADVRNIVRFARAAYINANEVTLLTASVKQDRAVKRESKASKPAKAGAIKPSDLAAMDAVLKDFKL